MEYSAKIKQELAFYQALLNELLDSSCQTIVLMDSDSKIVFSTDNIKTLIGYEPGELTGKSAFDFFQPDLHASKDRYKYLTEVYENTSFSLLQIQNKDGALLWIDVTVKNLLNVPKIQSIL